MAKNTVDYKEFIEEISEEISEGILSADDTIQVLRADQPVFQTYCPVVDWYYDDFTMNQELSTPLEEMFLPEEFSKEEWEEMKAQQIEAKKGYEEEKPRLTEIKAKDLLTEMKQMQKLFS